MAKRGLRLLLAIAFVVVVVVWLIKNPGPEHIEDTNGLDNYALQQITAEDVVANKMGCRGGLSTSKSHWGIAGINVSSGTKYSCKKFTGVSQLYMATVFAGSDVHVYLSDFRVNSGNFAFYVVLDGEIVGEVKPDDAGVAELIVENIDKTATLEYIIAGESANFEFTAPTEW